MNFKCGRLKKKIFGLLQISAKKSKHLSLYGRIRVGENPYPRMFYAELRILNCSLTITAKNYYLIEVVFKHIILFKNTKPSQKGLQYL